jgi:hypothetical protein
MNEQQSSSSKIFDSLEGNMETIKEEQLDIVTALTTPLQQNIIKKHAETLKRFKTQENEIRDQQRQIDELNFELSIKEAHMQNVRNEANIRKLRS